MLYFHIPMRKLELKKGYAIMHTCRVGYPLTITYCITNHNCTKFITAWLAPNNTLLHTQPETVLILLVPDKACCIIKLKQYSICQLIDLN